MAVASLGTACGPGGGAPEVQDIPDQVVAVSEELVIRIDASDPDGDDLSYSYEAEIPLIRSRATLSQLPVGSGEFRWTPMADDVGVWYVDFTVSDGDHESTVTVQIDVRSAVGANSAPRFLQPVSNGTTLDLSSSRCLELDIAIDDADSVDVDLSQAEPIIEGATLDQTSGTGGLWRWCPSPEQIGAGTRYTLSLRADDGDNPPTVLHYLIILRRPAKDNCPGESPVVTHTPMDASTLGNIAITATVTDDIGIKDSPVVYYSTTAPANPPNLAAMNLATMNKTGSTTWSASLLNPVATLQPGASATLYYLILARDDDDPLGACDHETIAPGTGSYQATITHPGGSGGLASCTPCVADVQCGSSASDLCVRVGSGGAAYCLEGCTGPSDCGTGYTCSASPVESIQGNQARQCLPESESCELQCTDDGYEDNDTRTQAAAKPALQPGSISAASCPLFGSDDDEDWYRIVVAADADVELELAGTEATDLDLYLYDADGKVVLGSAGFSSQESVSICLSPGTYYARVVANSIAPNTYTLSYASAPSTCAAPICNDDPLEENDGSDQASMVVLDGGSPASYVRNDLQICSGDEDWFAVGMYTGENLAVLVDFVHADGDIDVAIFDSDATTVLDAGISTDDSELVVYTHEDPSCASNPCVLYVAVVGYDGASNDYDLTIEVE